MEPNDNPPSEREWTIEEQEEFFRSRNAVTGLFDGAVANGVCSPLGWQNTSAPKGIVVTHIVPPEQGWPIAYYCPLCRETTFLLSIYAAKPKDGDYWRMSGMCVNEELHHRHNMTMALGRVSAPGSNE